MSKTKAVVVIAPGARRRHNQQVTLVAVPHGSGSVAKDQGYSSARNVPGNVQVEFTGPATARVQSSTVAPHFLTIGPKSPATDFIEARYVNNVVRGNDGVWRTVEFDLVVQQIWRGAGTYPFAQK